MILLTLTTLTKFWLIVALIGLAALLLTIYWLCKLFKNATEINKAESIYVNGKRFETFAGARIRAEGLYKRKAINAEIVICEYDREVARCTALDIWDFKR